MKKKSRNNENFLDKFFIYIKLFFKIMYAVLKKKTSLKLNYLHLLNKLFHKPKLNDDFDWDKYHIFYDQELKDGAKNFSLIINKHDFILKKNKIINKKGVKDLHPNHRLLYETILKIKPKSILEIGCGGGDHLANLVLLNKNFKLFGIDRSFEQINILKNRHPNLKVSLEVKDITKKNCNIANADLIFTQAVLMHISETKKRLSYALKNILNSSIKHIVFIENWTSHHFLNDLNKVIRTNNKFKLYKFYIASSNKDLSVKALVMSKKKLPFPKLLNYEQLLQGKLLRTH
jgi:SAM-dependent methyltransferase